MTAHARQRLVAIVRGRVQGVGFRWFVRQQAGRLQLSGWVANRADGGVDVVAEGMPAALHELQARLREGPLGASVSSVEASYEPARGITGFETRSGEHRGD